MVSNEKVEEERLKRSWIRFGLVTPLLAALVVTVWGAISVTPAYAWSIHAECDENGRVVGEIGVPVAGSFDIYVPDHRPSEGFWVEIPGSRQKITVVAGKEGGMVSFGPLDISNARDGINLIRVEQTATPEKSDSFKPCSKSPTPTLTSTATVTATATNTPMKTSTPVTPTETNTPKPKTHTPTRTSTPPVTFTAMPPTNTPVPPTATPAPCKSKICLPETGMGTGGISKNPPLSFSVLAVILTAILGGTLAVIGVRVRPN